MRRWPSNFGSSKASKACRGGNGLGAGQPRLTNGVGKLQGEQLRQEQKEASYLGGKLPAVGQC
jgi:hypothetical protein